MLHIYSKLKANKHLPYRLLKSLPILKGAWKLIALDFIVKLLLLKDPLIGIEYDLILVIIERLTKYRYFIPYLEVSDVEALTYTFS